MLAASIVIDGIVATPAALLQRDFRAGRRMAIDQVNSWLGAIVSISCALAGMGAMSLAVGRIAAALVAAVMFIHAEPVRFGFDREIARKLLRFGVPLAASSVVVFGVKFVDQFIVGSVLGPVALASTCSPSTSPTGPSACSRSRSATSRRRRSRAFAATRPRCAARSSPRSGCSPPSRCRCASC